jgi:hypothetical protein
VSGVFTGRPSESERAAFASLACSQSWYLLWDHSSRLRLVSCGRKRVLLCSVDCPEYSELDVNGTTPRRWATPDHAIAAHRIPSHPIVPHSGVLPFTALSTIISHRDLCSANGNWNVRDKSSRCEPYACGTASRTPMGRDAKPGLSRC